MAIIINGAQNQVYDYDSLYGKPDWDKKVINTTYNTNDKLNVCFFKFIFKKIIKIRDVHVI